MIAFTKKERTAAARYGSEDARLLPIDLEIEYVDVVSQAYFQTAHRKGQ